MRGATASHPRAARGRATRAGPATRGGARRATTSCAYTHPAPMSDSCSRRDFLSQTSSCAAHLALAAAALPGPLRARWARAVDDVVAREPFGALQRVAEGVWALVSTPLLGDRTTVCNGGVIAGRSGVLAIEGFMQPAGAAWLAGKARELT